MYICFFSLYYTDIFIIYKILKIYYITPYYMGIFKTNLKRRKTKKQKEIDAKNKKLANTPKQVAQRKRAYELRKGKKPPPPKTFFV
tara:strand:- start:221 stop:478 length:258 start_codon:yes stop_codon:yes gene_type:complete